MIKHAFIVTSAINSKFGVFDPNKRLIQTVDTIESIRKRVPGATVILMECCGEPLKQEQIDILTSASDVFINYSTDPDVQAMYDSDNWDVVKNGTEIMCFGRVLNKLKQEGYFETNGIDRIHKMSGRYILNDFFDTATYEDTVVQEKIVIGKKYQSQFPIAVTQVPLQYMARLWSWPLSLLDEVIGVYEDSFVFFAQRLAAGGYVDIEHVLYKFLNPNHVHEIENTGVEGQIAPTGQPIKN
jgi:hypothetical protein